MPQRVRNDPRRYNRRKFSPKEIKRIRRRFREFPGGRGVAKALIAHDYDVSSHRIHKELVRCGEIQGKPRKSVHWTNAELKGLRRRYLRRFEPDGEGEGVVVQIAREKGCSIHTVYEQLRKCGIEVTRKRPERFRRLVVADYLKSGSSAKTGKKFGIPPLTVTRWAQEAGIDTRGGFPWTRKDDAILRREARRRTAPQLVTLIGRGVTIDAMRNRLKVLGLKSTGNADKRRYAIHELPEELAESNTRIYVMLGRRRTAYVGQTRTKIRVRVKNNLLSAHGRAKSIWARREHKAGALRTIEVLHVPIPLASAVEHTLANALAQHGYRLKNTRRERSNAPKGLIEEALRVLANPPEGRFSPSATKATIYAVEQHKKPRYVGYTIRELPDRLDSHFASARGGERSRFYRWLRRQPSREGITIRRVEVVAPAIAPAREREWIGKLKKKWGRQILNEKQ